MSVCLRRLAKNERSAHNLRPSNTAKLFIIVLVLYLLSGNHNLCAQSVNDYFDRLARPDFAVLQHLPMDT